ncbi:hypothetical protein [Microtetraspora sp. NBRC 16547]|uniref:hypothetical protein n=1 Tax=Microtetraspora sp. NBRC 16547 TaxID=3030993 RepID=UPI0024A3823A|nr:hypothetical protein [Microtetraspora sp. NBRC 16547]GLW99837.1 hypothetical protein Misp02_39240 [Microtetraspora sp. NBRC 16547]
MTETGAEPSAGLRFLRGASAAHDSQHEPRRELRPEARPGLPGEPGQETRPVPQAPRGGDEAVQGAMSTLRRLGELPVAEHVGVFEEALSLLESALASVDEPMGEPRR